MSDADDILAVGERVRLRRLRERDAEIRLAWLDGGQWLEFDAPWEQFSTPETPEERAKFITNFVARLQRQEAVLAAAARKGQSLPPARAIIVTTEGHPIGLVNRYGDERFPSAWKLGIDICEDAYLDRGYGREALGLWVDYLFGNSDIHKLGLDTWSMNPRMLRVAEILGFRPEGVERELFEWRGQWLDRHGFGLLRTEWEQRQR